MRLAGRDWVNTNTTPNALVHIEEHEDCITILKEQVKYQSARIEELEKKIRWYQDRLDSARRKLKR